ncbi:hypothetical protein G3I15_00660, partial [Streptomyces sp. SID10244]|nr:hypothetical protein [Streptomyces sp. SID10244]
SEMVRSTEPLVRLLAQQVIHGKADNTVMLEVLTRRYYGNKGLTDVRIQQAGGARFVVAVREGAKLASAAVSFDNLGPALAGLAELARDTPSIDADIYL